MARPRTSFFSIKAEPALGIAAAALLHRSRWGTASDKGKMARRAAAETAILGELRRWFLRDPRGAVPIEEILVTAAAVAETDPARMVLAGEFMWDRGRLPQGWPGQLGPSVPALWIDPRAFGLAPDRLAALLSPEGETLPVEIPFYPPRPPDYEPDLHPDEPDFPALSAAAPFPTHGAGFGVELARAALVLARHKPFSMVYWVKHWSWQARVHEELSAAALEHFQTTGESIGSETLFAAALGAIRGLDNMYVFTGSLDTIRALGARMLAERPDEVLAGMRRTLRAWFLGSPELYTARPWCRPGDLGIPDPLPSGEGRRESARQEEVSTPDEPGTPSAA